MKLFETLFFQESLVVSGERKDREGVGSNVIRNLDYTTVVQVPFLVPGTFLFSRDIPFRWSSSG